MTRALRPALFLDRDGVINIDHGYVGSSERFDFVPGIFDLVRTGLDLGFVPVVVTNQSGIARGLFDESAFLSLTHWMCERFAAMQAPLAAVYHCPYLPDAPLPQWRCDHPDRKPAPGMLLRASAELGLALNTSVLIGDKNSDIAAARAAGVLHSILLTSQDQDGQLQHGEPFGDVVVLATLADAQAQLLAWGSA